MTTPLPGAAACFLNFAELLRRDGFAAAPEQVIAFMAAIHLLGPRSMEDIRQAAYATFAPPIERHGAFEALFRSHFFGEGAPPPAPGEDETVTLAADPPSEVDRTEWIDTGKAGTLASSAEHLASRRFTLAPACDLLQFERRLPTALPVRRSFRRERTRSRGLADLRRSFSAMVRNDGDVPAPALVRRRLVSRRLILLIDISGSMKSYTANALRLAHAVLRSRADAEVFTLGTRLTRITPALRSRHAPTALERVARLAPDWDGGTRLGPTLLAFLATPRFAGLALGAWLVLLSDALERGDQAELLLAIRRLRGLAFRVSLATPLAADPRFRPETAALQAILPYLDDLVDGSSPERIGAFLLSLRRSPPYPPSAPSPALFDAKDR